MIFRVMIHALLLAAFCVLIPATTFAQEQTSIERILSEKEFRVGVTGNQPPFCVRSKDGELMGYEIDLAMLLAEAMGVEVKFVEMRFAELLPALSAGKIDAVMSGMTMTPERNMKAAFVGPYIVSGKSILTKSATLAKAEEAEDLDQAKVRLAALKGSTSQAFVETYLPKAQLTTTDEYAASVEMVLTDKVDALVADFPICMLSLMRNPGAGLATLVEPLTIEPIGMALPPDEPLLVNMVQNYLGALAMIGLLDELEVAWFEDDSWLILLP